MGESMGPLSALLSQRAPRPTKRNSSDLVTDAGVHVCGFSEHLPDRFAVAVAVCAALARNKSADIRRVRGVHWRRLCLVLGLVDRAIGRKTGGRIARGGPGSDSRQARRASAVAPRG